MAYTISGQGTIEGGSIVLSNGTNTTTLSAPASVTSYTLTLPSNEGGVTSMFQSTGTTTSRFRSSLPMTWYVKDIEPASTFGQTLPSSTWTTRVLNTIEEPSESSGEVTLTSNQIILQDGAYYVNAIAAMTNSGFGTSSQTRLANITLGTFDYGEVDASSGGEQSVGGVSAIYIVPSNTTYTLEVQTQPLAGSFGGINSSLSSNAFVMVKVVKLSNA